MSKVNLMNDKHYPDPTTHDALRKVLRDEKEIDERCRLLVTAGSDYHGTNKTVSLGQTGGADPVRLQGFYEAVADLI